MAVTSGFYNSVSGDRKYNALQMSSIFDGIIEDGVYSTIGDHFSVTAGTGNTVIVGTGRAWFNHTWTLNDADYPVTLEPSEVVLNRYDAIVIEVNGSNAVRGNSIKVIKGTPGSSPSKPSLAKGDSNIWQHPLAYVYVPAGSSSISQSNIEYVVGKSECPFVVAAVQSVNIDALVAQWQDEFDTWFDNLEYQLSGDVAGNLQNQINQKADKANIIDDPDDLLANQATGMIAGAKAVAALHANLAETVYDRSDLPIADFYDVRDFDLRKRGNEVFFNVSLSMQSGTQFDPNMLYSIGPSPMLSELRPQKVYFLNGYGCDSNWGNPTAISTFVDEKGYVRYCASVRKAYFKISGHWFTD